MEFEKEVREGCLKALRAYYSAQDGELKKALEKQVEFCAKISAY